MPSISIKKADLYKLVGRDISNDQLETFLELVKGELKRSEHGNDDLKVELNDTNRPDTWCIEGIARQFRYKMGLAQPKYDFFGDTGKYVLQAKKSVMHVRPVIGAFVCKDITISPELLEQLIQTQEKLCENFGSKRRSVAIGVYNFDRIEFPVIYKGFLGNEAKFVPLSCAEEMTLNEILEKHPKGQQYASLLNGVNEYPVLIDSADQVLSFPPIINSRLVGEVDSASRNLFIEATGDDLSKVSLALNILAYNLADRGGKIESVRVNYEYSIEGHTSIIFPSRLANEISIEHRYFEAMIGEAVPSAEIVKLLGEYGCLVQEVDGKYQVSTEQYRYDYLHPVDVVEDFTISKGYNAFKPQAPDCFTVGKLDSTTSCADKARSLLVGFGLEEVFSNMLISNNEVRHKTLFTTPMIEIDNAMTESDGVVRNSLVPCLMRVEATSGNAMYPHRFFEVGEVVVCDSGENRGSKTIQSAAMCFAHHKACFSELHSHLENFMYYMGYDFDLEHTELPWLIPGRSARVIVDGKEVGVIGEIHPQVLNNWDIKVPCVVFEIDLSFAVN